MIFNKTAIAVLIALAATSAANAKIIASIENGWQLSVTGKINQFMIMTDDKNRDDYNEVRGGRIAGFIKFNIKIPKTNGLNINAHISLSPSTNKSGHQNLEQREIYFTVDGEFGQILAGRALGLYGSHNMVTEQTYRGVGYGTGGNANSTLGGIGIGHDYAAWRQQFRWTSKRVKGLQIAFSISENGGGTQRLQNKLPTGSMQTSQRDSKDRRYEGDVNYKGVIDGGKYMFWFSGMNTGNDIANKADAPKGEQAITVGATLHIHGWEFMTQYSDSSGSTDAKPENENENTKAKKAQKVRWDQYVLQGGYRFKEKTLVSVNYSRVLEYSLGAKGNANEADRWTFGIYHDLTDNLRLIAEVCKVITEKRTILYQKDISFGAEVRW
ncbi:MAG: porin [Piscirickettsiaceae bacterium]|nr:porin [Piscirickettsiaceae bacterium]